MLEVVAAAVAAAAEKATRSYVDWHTAWLGVPLS